MTRGAGCNRDGTGKGKRLTDGRRAPRKYRARVTWVSIPTSSKCSVLSSAPKSQAASSDRLRTTIAWGSPRGTNLLGPGDSLKLSTAVTAVSSFS